MQSVSVSKKKARMSSKKINEKIPLNFVINKPNVTLPRFQLDFHQDSTFEESARDLIKINKRRE
jgi:hypothetical protein